MSANSFDDQPALPAVVDALLRPPPIPMLPGARPRVALLGPDHELRPNAEDAGLHVTFQRELGTDSTPLDFGQIPDFDAVIADLPTGEGQGDAFAFVRRFLSIRRPSSFVLMSRADIDDEFVEWAQGQLGRMGYRLHVQGTNVVGMLA